MGRDGVEITSWYFHGKCVEMFRYGVFVPRGGHGLITQGPDAAIELCRQELEIDRLEAQFRLVNGSSAVIVDKLGFEQAR
ncbi:hypothetical protein [Ferrimicrobium sp.]|uniref:hypothetical protein n=1 Tax=Ferrimicrobium sp. TaxID=2926050 RepID=UPI00260E9F16|nr:hypothetical protein [Ferrimicrobium sp.]